MKKWDKIPENSIAIGSDGCENEFILYLGEDAFGHVFFWDHEKIEDKDKADLNDFSNMFKVANGFSSFTDMISI